MSAEPASVVNVWLINWLDVIGFGLVLAGLIWSSSSLANDHKPLEAQLERSSVALANFPMKIDKTGWLKQDIQLAGVNYLRPRLACGAS